MDLSDTKSLFGFVLCYWKLDLRISTINCPKVFEMWSFDPKICGIEDRRNNEILRRMQVERESVIYNQRLDNLGHIL